MATEQNLLTLREFCESRRISRSFAYLEIASGRLTVVKVGRSTRVPVEAAIEWDRKVRAGELAPRREPRVCAKAT